MVKRTTMISTRWDLPDIEDIEKTVRTNNPKGKFDNVSEAVRELSKIGLKVLSYQEMMKNPEKANEFQVKMNEMLQTQQMDQWSQTLSTEQIDGFLMFLQIEKEKRFEQKQFI